MTPTESTVLLTGNHAVAWGARLARPRVVNGVRLRIRTSVGWVLHDGQTKAQDMLSSADAAMYEHKRSRRGG